MSSYVAFIHVEKAERMGLDFSKIRSIHDLWLSGLNWGSEYFMFTKDSEVSRQRSRKYETNPEFKRVEF